MPGCKGQDCGTGDNWSIQGGVLLVYSKGGQLGGGGHQGQGLMGRRAGVT